MKLDYHRYILNTRSEVPLNSRSKRSEISGALIRLNGLGVGCIHPWTELGDACLDDELQALKNGSPMTLGKIALECARTDGQARQQGRSLFENVSDGNLPASHWSTGPDDDPADVVADGFDTAKLKLGADLSVALELTERWATCRGIYCLRLDFNTALTDGKFIEFWEALSDRARAKVQFVEDPTPFNSNQWQTLQNATGASLALDLRPGQSIDNWDSWLVLKPAVLTTAQLRAIVDKHDPAKLVFTSYMDHAIGQLWAIYGASLFPQVSNLAGLLTHERFASDDMFFDQIDRKGPRLQPPSGNGLGFDNSLEGLPWKPLI